MRNLKYTFLLYLFSMGCFYLKPVQENIPNDYYIHKEIGPNAEVKIGIIEQLYRIIKGSCKYPSFLEIGGITSLANGSLVISDKINGWIYIYPRQITDCNDIKKFTLKNRPIIVDVDYNDSTLYLLNNEYKEIVLLDMNFTEQKIISIDSIYSAQKLLVIRDQIYVVDPRGNQIITIHNKTDEQTFFSQIDSIPLWLPQDITVSSFGEVFILNNLGRSLIQTDTQFSFVKEIKLPSPPPYLFPKSIYHRSNGNLIIRDSAKKRLYEVKLNGELVSIFPPDYLSEFIVPHEFHLLGNDQIVVVDKSKQTVFYIGMK